MTGVSTLHSNGRNPRTATSAIAVGNVRLTSIRDINRSRRTCAIRPSLAKPISIGSSMWYYNTAQVTGET